MRIKSVLWVAIVGIGIMTALRTSAAGQAAQTNQDTLAALLTEVRGLRAAMEQIASAGPRVQLAMGRLQLQEQRVNTLVRRTDELRTTLARVQSEATDLQQRSTGLQRRLNESQLTPEERAGAEAEIKAIRQNLTRQNAEIQRLQAEEADAASQAASEQQRWVEINQRLEELDRALGRR